MQKKNRTDQPIFLPEEEKSFGVLLSGFIETRPGTYVLPRDSFAKAYTFTDTLLLNLLAIDNFSNKENYTWTIKLLKDSNVNIFSSCDGTIYITSGLVHLLPSLEQFAGILAQEMYKMDARFVIKKTGAKYGNYSITSSIQAGYIYLMDSIEYFVRRVPVTYEENYKADHFSVDLLYPTTIDARGLARFYASINDFNDEEKKSDFMVSHPGFNMKIQAIYDRWNSLGAKNGNTYLQEYENFKKLIP